MSSVEASDTGIWFVYRRLYEGLAGKRVRRRPDATVLGWFRRMWAPNAAVVDIDDEWEAHRWVAEQLAAELGAACPSTCELHEHAYAPTADQQQGPDMGHGGRRWSQPLRDCPPTWSQFGRKHPTWY
jgi:hypothetical protein